MHAQAKKEIDLSVACIDQGAHGIEATLVDRPIGFEENERRDVLPSLLRSTGLQRDRRGKLTHARSIRIDAHHARRAPQCGSTVTERAMESCELEGVRGILLGKRVEPGQVREIALGRVVPLDADADMRLFLNRYARIAMQHSVQPSLQLRYQREAYSSSVDQYARITFDRQIVAQRTSQWSLEPDTDHWCFFDDWWRPGFSGKPVLLELKCHSSMPGWMIELTKRNDLQRVSFSKYSVGIYVTGRRMGQDLMTRRSARAMR